MRSETIPAEFGFKALIKNVYVQATDLDGKDTTCIVWELSNGFFFSLEEAQKAHGADVKWPIEVFENGAVVIPDEKEVY